ncbi:dimethyladenosine transferase [Carpediemonas membranifera]|uniref:rRNA adenine N(6)-methyltransferase n=1 Tax=Carpediemonas membranifera TaxID=201153 RepID=A0A8J6BXP0_9EUKA|nr:dimethyladenosine transferase [Carpediemonas membranifera]|eukprot:KAG9393681.1 dimethyladenosine transferase [Carpediemonas membranifera]
MPSGVKRAARTGAQHGQLLTKLHGQHLLTDQKIINKIVDAAKVRPHHTVLEIGPGKGALTKELVKRAKKVIAIEYDPRQVVDLQKQIPREHMSKLKIVHGDFLKVDITAPDMKFDMVVSNCPYNISSGIVFKLLCHANLFTHAVLMFQKEFADRLVAQPGTEDWCRLAVNTQLLADTRHLMKVSRKCFSPPPKVESSVIMLTPKNAVPPGISLVEWEAFVTDVFPNKGKTLSRIFKTKSLLKNMVKNYALQCSLENTPIEADKIPAKVDSIIAAVMEQRVMAGDVEEGLEGDVVGEIRPRMLRLEQILWLLKEFNKRGIHFK